MKQLTKLQFLEGYEEGFITDIVSFGSKIYGKDPRGMANQLKRFEVVFCDLS